MINYSLSPHLSFTTNLRLISCSNHSRLSLLAPFHSPFFGSLNLALFSFHITIIITVSLISSHFISYTAYYCSIVSENKSASSFHSYLVGFYRHSKSPHSSSLLFSYRISSYVIILCHSHFILWGNRYRYLAVVVLVVTAATTSSTTYCVALSQAQAPWLRISHTHCAPVEESDLTEWHKFRGSEVDVLRGTPHALIPLRSRTSRTVSAAELNKIAK